jgi:hypothetical protein
MAHTTYSLAQLYAVVEGKIPKNDAISRQILDALLTLKADKIFSGAHECPAQHQNRGDNYD